MASSLVAAGRDLLRRHAERAAANRDPYAQILESIGPARFVLIGEASHGTHEFYRERAELTQRLIAEKSFAAVAGEADWPDALRVNRFAQGRSDDRDATEALGGFARFPTWMWRNADVLDFVGWLRDFNDARPPLERVGFYGLDLYSLHASIDAVISYLERVDPQAAQRARRHYGCFEFTGDPQDYAYAMRLGLQQSCHDDVTRELLALRERASAYLHLDGRVAEDEYFYAEQNARVAKDAEEYYRTMLDERVSSWNLRDRHMLETLVQLAEHLEHRRRPAKVVVWAHNSHVGDARATEMSRRGEYNIGELTRRRFPAETRNVGFTTYAGTVSAASDWGAQVERKNIWPGIEGSYERLFHESGVARFPLVFGRETGLGAVCRGPLLERAIGVIYRPETERWSHYFMSELPAQFDAIVHIDHTRAVEPLDRSEVWEAGEVPETFPTGV